MIVLDTNVISEIIKPSPDQNVISYLERWPNSDLFITSITLAEILAGISLLPEGKRQRNLFEAIAEVFESRIAEFVLPFDNFAARVYADIFVRRRSAGRPISSQDAMIAAICYSHNAQLVTRNVRDFELCGVSLLNPWQQLNS